MQIKLNMLNHLVAQGKVKKIRTEGKYSWFWLDTNKGDISVRTDYIGLTEGSIVWVEGKIRYSNTKDTHKIIASRVKECGACEKYFNNVVMEVYPIEVDGERVKAKHLTLTAEGAIYNCYIDLKIKPQVITLNELYLITGYLECIKGKWRIRTEYIKPNKPIIREV